VLGFTSGVTQVSAGDYHTCAVLDAGSATCWGHNLYGQLGDGTTTQSTAPITVSGLSTGVVQISAAESHTCAVTAAGSVKCWGWNASFGQLGDGTYTNRYSPVQVTGLTTGAARVSAGSHHTCALLANGTAKCWGCNNGRGQLGDGTTTGRNTPVTVGGLNAT
jgi:alpha-tubulin suppressor-like RCC1 family protein